MSVQIRHLQKGDGSAELVALSRAFFAEYEAHHEEFFQIDSLSDEGIISYFSSFLGEEDRAAFVAVQQGRVVGYITVYAEIQPALWQVKRVGHISGLMVGQVFRRAGIGSLLLAQARAFFRDRGVKYYTAYTAAENRGAIEFYCSQGLEPLHTHFVGEIQ